MSTPPGAEARQPQKVADYTSDLRTLGQEMPSHLCPLFNPATHYVYEWQPYWIICPSADCLRIGTGSVDPIVPGRDLFCLRFENQLGLARAQAYAQGRPLGAPLYLEVLSPKFPTPGEHLAFYHTLLDELFIRATRLPFTFSAPTGRGVVEALRPPTPLFTLHFLCQYAPALRQALTIIQAAPHRQLRDNPRRVPLAEAAEADADVLLSILHNPQEWQPTSRAFPLAVALKGRAPARVWQRRPEETADTPENRFVLHFLQQVLVAAEGLPAQPWWRNVPLDRQGCVREAASLLHQALALAPLDEVGPMQRLPFSSQVLLRREGYREMLALWRLFQQARRPLFAPLQQAIELRDIATLYEFWVFFALVEEIGVCLGESPVIDLRPSDKRGLEWHSEARFGEKGTLVYSRGFRRPTSYSLPLRPDFTWMVGGRPEVVLDAKFHLERAELEAGEEEDTPQATAKRADLYKMHTYRDALGVRAAVAVYPGDEAVFYECAWGKRPGITLSELLLGEARGIGALPMRPGRMGREG